MTDSLLEAIKSLTGATDVFYGDKIQSLWSGYGQIVRVHLSDLGASGNNDRSLAPADTNQRGPVSVRAPLSVPGSASTLVLKSINPPVSLDHPDVSHPRGWNTDTSHQRKLRSYDVEQYWYKTRAADCLDDCRVAAFYGAHIEQGMTTLILEDLDSEYPRRCHQLEPIEASVCLHWLASMHATFMADGASAQDTNTLGLWPVGTYWHLETRQDEFIAMEDGQLKQSAELLDRRLSDARFQTLVHGDAKLANFCFSRDLRKVAAVDFQYVGGGCGMKDLVYFLGSCLPEAACADHQDFFLDQYFTYLTKALEKQQPSIDAQAVEEEWRGLYEIAWTDFYRFLLGWMPEHQKINRYTEKQALTAYELLGVKTQV